MSRLQAINGYSIVAALEKRISNLFNDLVGTVIWLLQWNFDSIKDVRSRGKGFTDIGMWIYGVVFARYEELSGELQAGAIH